MPRRKADNTFVRWLLIAGVVAFVAVADWMADGIGPRLVLGSATLQLSSEPAGARVLLDGEAIGETPLRYRDVRPGSAAVRFEHRFHDAVVRRITVARDDVRRIHIDFPPSAGTLEIVSNPRGAQLRIVGKPLDAIAPIVLSDYPAGAYDITATLAGRQPETQSVEVLPRQATTVSFELERLRVGEVFVDLAPRDAQLEIVGVDERYRPSMTLPLGAYEFRARRHGYGSQSFSLDVRRGRNRHAVRLERLYGTLDLTVQPAAAIVEVSYQQAGEWSTSRYQSAPLRIPAGPVEIRARAVGYRNYQQRLTLTAKILHYAIELVPFDIQPGRRFRDALASGGQGPLLAIIPAGVFRMGSEDDSADERPVRTVTVSQPFAMGVFEVTQAEFDRQPAADALAMKKPIPTPSLPVPADMPAQHPVTDVPWREAQGYVDWLSRETGYRYRLPSEAEWEYAARAGSASRYYFGDDPSALCAYENIADATLATRYRKYSTAACSDDTLGLAPVGQFKANAFGLHDMLGNAEEWVADCWHNNYRGAPATAQARVGNCASRVVRGGTWDSAPDAVTVSYRSLSSGANDSRGFRVVREL